MPVRQHDVELQATDRLKISLKEAVGDVTKYRVKKLIIKLNGV